jgi:hypothetical protein
MEAIEIGRLAILHTMQWDSPQPMKIYFGDLLCIEGNSTGFTNPAIEAAILHSRALLEFLGFGAESDSRLAVRKPTRCDDLVVEGFSNVHGPLKKVSVPQALQLYEGGSEEAEHALAYVIHAANKGLAHTTSSFLRHDESSNLLEIAFRGVNSLMVKFFYQPMGLEPPRYTLQARKRNA